MLIRATVAALALLAASAPAFAVIIQGTNLSFGPAVNPPPFDTTHGSRIIQALNGDYTEIWFKYTNNSLQAKMWDLDEESDWYLAPAGADFSTATIAAHQFTPIFVLDVASPPVELPIGDFYVGINTGTSLPPPPNFRGVFGWALLHNSGADLVMLDNAMAYGENGIVIGAVPEPASLGLLGAGTALAMLHRRRLSRPRSTPETVTR